MVRECQGRCIESSLISKCQTVIYQFVSYSYEPEMPIFVYNKPAHFSRQTEKERRDERREVTKQRQAVTEVDGPREQ